MKRFNLHSTIVRWFSAIVIVLCFVVAAPARTWTPEEVPIPRLQDVRRYVSNPEQILSAATVDSLDRLLGALERDRGVQTLVVVVDRLKGDDPYRFAMTLARKYGVGNRETRTGLVVVLATGDRSYQFLTGNGLEGTLPDGLIQQIEDRIFILISAAGSGMPRCWPPCKPLTTLVATMANCGWRRKRTNRKVCLGSCCYSCSVCRSVPTSICVTWHKEREFARVVDRKHCAE